MCGGGGARHNAAATGTATAVSGLSRRLLFLLVLVPTTLPLLGLGWRRCCCGGRSRSRSLLLSGRTRWTVDALLLLVFASPNYSPNPSGGTRRPLPFVAHDLFVVCAGLWG